MSVLKMIDIFINLMSFLWVLSHINKIIRKSFEVSLSYSFLGNYPIPRTNPSRSQIGNNITKHNNHYLRHIVLGKSLLWDMRDISSSIESCRTNISEISKYRRRVGKNYPVISRNFFRTYKILLDPLLVYV